MKIEYKPIERRTRLLLAFLRIYLLLLCINAIVAVNRYLVYSKVDPDFIPEPDVQLGDWIFTIGGSIQSLFLLVIYIVFAAWIYRVSMNLHILSDTKMKYSPVGALGWYFVPVLNIFKPYLAMKEIWMVSHKDYGPSSFLKLWWFCWLFSGVVSTAVWNYSVSMDTLSRYIAFCQTYVVGNIVDIFLTLFALLLVQRIAQASSENYNFAEFPDNTSPQHVNS